MDGDFEMVQLISWLNKEIKMCKARDQGVYYWKGMLRGLDNVLFFIELHRGQGEETHDIGPLPSSS